MIAIRLLGLIFVFALICDKGRTELVIPILGQDQVPQANENSFAIEIPLGNGNVIQADNNVQSVQRRLSLEDFFLNRNQQEQQQPSPPPIQAPVTQFQVQQPDPNSLFLVRDAQFPNPTGGLISRLLLARRMLRLRRIARRLTIIPRLFGLGLRQTLQRSARNPLSLFSNRVGETYDPREFVFGNRGFSYQNNATSNVEQRDANSDQLQQQSRGYAVEADPYYSDTQDSNYDDNSRSNNYEDQLRQQQDILNSLTDEQQLLLLQQLQNYQQQLNQLNERLNNQPNNNQVNGQFQQPQQNYKNVQPNQYQLDEHDDQQNNQLNDNQLEQVRLIHAQLLREQQLQQQLQQLQLNQQSQNLRQHQNLASIEQNSNFQENNHEQLIHDQNAQQHDDGNVGDRTEGGGYPSAIGIGNSAGQSIGGGVGINVGIRPPAVDIQVTNPGVSGIKPLPPIVNPIVQKPVQQAPVAQPLVPLGLLPKPILNLKGRLFFGAEMGKGAGLKTGAKR